MTFDVDGDVLTCSISGITMEYKGIVSLVYEHEIVLGGIASNVLGLMTNGSYVRMYIGSGSNKSFIAEGTLMKLYTYLDGSAEYTKIILQDLGYKTLSESSYTGLLSGDTASVIKNLVDLNVRKTYTDSDIIYRHASGRHLDILKDLVKDKGRVWNVKGNTLWIGNTLSSKVFNLGAIGNRVYSGRVRDDDGNTIKVADVQIKFTPEARPGDIIKIGSKNYIIVAVNHKYRNTQKVMLKASYLKAVTTMDNVYNLVQYYDDERRIEEISNFEDPSSIYDPEYNELSYYDHERKSYLADLQEKSFVLHTVAGATYLDYIGGIATSASVGVYIPYDIRIIGIGVFCSYTDDAVVRVRRNGINVSAISILDRIPKYELKDDSFAGDGLMAVYVDIGGGFQGVDYMIVNVYYRRVVKYE